MGGGGQVKNLIEPTATTEKLTPLLNVTVRGLDTTETFSESYTSPYSGKMVDPHYYSFEFKYEVISDSSGVSIGSDNVDRNGDNWGNPEIIYVNGLSGAINFYGSYDYCRVTIFSAETDNYKEGSWIGSW